jgi:sugar lactone lactonase YvrE
MKTLLFFLAFATAPALFLAQTPSNIEAVEWDPAGRWFVTNGSNILSTSNAGATWSVFSNEGATHGMEVMDGHLFALDQNIIRAINLETETETSSLSIPGASFLNGMGSRTGELIVSDFSSGRLHRVDVSDPAAMTSSVFVNNLGVTPNGVAIDEANNRAIVVTWNACQILAVDLTTAAVTTLAGSTGLSNCDGVDLDGSGRAYVSSWSPARITRFSPDFATAEAVVTSGLSNPADISYALDLDTLAVANSGSDLVTFHGFAPAVTVAEVATTGSTWRISGSDAVIENGQAGTLLIEGHDAAGRLLWNGAVNMAEGRSTLPLLGLAGAGWEGTWLVVFTHSNGQRSVIKRGPHQW